MTCLAFKEAAVEGYRRSDTTCCYLVTFDCCCALGCKSWLAKWDFAERADLSCCSRISLKGARSASWVASLGAIPTWPAGHCRKQQHHGAGHAWAAIKVPARCRCRRAPDILRQVGLPDNFHSIMCALPPHAFPVMYSRVS